MEPTGFGVIGAGTWGQLHARVYAATHGARLAGVCDLDAARARRVADECGGAPVYEDYRELLASPAVQAVSIVLPDHLHRDAAVAAAEAGKHVLIEKPVATTEADALDIVGAARRAGVHLFVDFHNRWSPLFRSLKQSLEAGELGAPRMAYYRLNDTIYVPTRMLGWASRSTVAWFLASHCLDTLLWLTGTRPGADAVERVYCVARSSVLRDQHGIDTPDSYQALLEWRSGFVAHVENCWILPESTPSVFDLKCEFVGSRGAVHIDGSHHGAVQKATDTLAYPDVFVAPTTGDGPTGFGVESIRHFAARVVDGRTPAIDGLDGLAVTRLVLAMEASARSGQPVAVGRLYDCNP